MAKSGSGFKLDTSGLSGFLNNVPTNFDLAMRIKSTQYANQLQTDAQINAKWQDRTGEARRRLRGSYETISQYGYKIVGYKLILAHGVDYGIWLELANEKRYAIIMQTIEYTGTFAIMPDFKDFMDKVGGSSAK